MRRLLGLSFALVLSCFALGQDPPSSPAWKRAQHLRHGINASEWFAQSTDYSVQRLSTYTTLDDISLIRRLGFDHIRLSIDPAIFNCRSPWSDCERIKALDAVVDKTLAEGLAIIIDIHPTSEFKRQISTDNFAAEKFRLLWGQIADYFAARDPERIFFEIMNEPELKDPYRWTGIQERVIQEIRRRAPKHTIVVAGAAYSDIGDLVMLPQLNDDNLIFNFHYYEPHLFTHQGASWGVPFWIDLRDVPYPITPESAKKAIAEQPDSFSQWELMEMAYGHWNRERISGELGFASDWAKAHHVPLTCNEFGVYRNFSHPDDRARWIENVRTGLEANNIGWTMWDYRGGFGVVTKTNGTSTPDDQILHALGLK